MTRKKLWAFAVAIALIGCTNDTIYPEYRDRVHMRHVCDNDTIEKRAEFIINCVKGANPKSDEEPEDWLKICQTMAEQTYCPSKTVNVRQVHYCNNCGWHDLSITVASGSPQK